MEAPPAAPKVTVKRTNETGKVAGIAARRYEVAVEMDGETTYEDHWLATDAAFLRELAADRLNETMARFESCMKTGAGADDQFDLDSVKAYRDLKNEGFPLKVVVRQPGETEGETREGVSAVESVDVPEAEFAPPAGYRKVTLVELTASSAATSK
jgi:hypothetical protein